MQQAPQKHYFFISQNNAFDGFSYWNPLMASHNFRKIAFIRYRLKDEGKENYNSSQPLLKPRNCEAISLHSLVA